MLFFSLIIDTEALNWEKTRNDIYDEEAFQSLFNVESHFEFDLRKT